MWSVTNQRQRGVAVIELLLAVAVFGLVVTAVMGAIVYGNRATAEAGDYQRGVYLAEEGVEAVRNIRDAGYANLSDGTYGLAQSGNQWVLSGSSDIQGIYTRQVTISTVDSVRKSIVVNVSWLAGSISRQAQLDTRLTNWRTSTVLKSWANAILDGSNTLGSNNSGVKVATQGQYAYVVMQSGSPNLYVIDISNSASPTIVGSVNVSPNPRNIAVDGNYAYIATTHNNNELQIVDISNPALPVLVASYNAPGNGDAYGIRKVGNYAYLSRLANGSNQEVSIINVSNPAAPVLVGSYSQNINMRDLCVLGTYAYVGTDSGTQEILVLNVANPAVPTLLTSINLPGTTPVNAMRCYGSTVFAAQGTVLRAVTVAVPAGPVLAGSFTPSGSPTINDIGAKESANLLYLATNRTSGEFEIVDASNLAAMTSYRIVDIPGTTSTLNGAAYNSMLDTAAAVGASTAQQFVIVRPN